MSSSNRSNRAATPHPDALADVSTPSRSRTMLILTIPTVFMSLAACVLAGEAEIFVHDETDSYNPDIPVATISVHSRIGCSLQCSYLGWCSCKEVRYFANGTCLMYREPGRVETDTPPPEVTTSSEPEDGPVVYRRSPPPSTCPGL